MRKCLSYPSESEATVICHKADLSWNNVVPSQMIEKLLEGS